MCFSEAVIERKAQCLDSQGQTTKAKTKYSPVALREADNKSSVEPYQISSYHRHRSITEEVNRLMQEQDNFPEVPPVASGRGKKSQVRPQAVSQTSKVLINVVSVP